MEYFVVYNVFLAALVKEINKLLKQGWECQGGICVQGTQLYQAMTRRLR
jgi:hypothetical protein